MALRSHSFLSIIRVCGDESFVETVYPDAESQQRPASRFQNSNTLFVFCRPS